MGAQLLKKVRNVRNEHTVLPNLLNREFKQNIPGKVLLTDISYVFFKNGQKITDLIYNYLLSNCSFSSNAFFCQYLS